MSAVLPGRLQELVEGLEVVHDLCLQGTRFRGQSDGHYLGSNHEFAYAVGLGYTRGTFANRDSECDICFNKRFWEAKDVAGILIPPQILGGRGGAFRLPNKVADMLILNLSFPPRVKAGKGVTLYRNRLMRFGFGRGDVERS